MSIASESKYAKYSQVDPEFAPFYDAVYDQFKTLWSLPVDEMRKTLSDAPQMRPEDCPSDMDITHQMVTVSDGAEIEIRIYKPKDGKPGLPLFLVLHGGGKMVHCTLTALM